MNYTLKTASDIAEKIMDVDMDKSYVVLTHPSGDVDVFEKIDTGTKINFIPSPDENLNVCETSNYTLPALYGFDKKSKERLWKTWVVNDTVYKSYGEVGGALTTVKRSFKGLNIGKKNATTANEQSKREAERDWIKQLEKNYHPKCKEGLTLEKKVVSAKKKQNGINVNLDILIRRTDDEPVLSNASDEDDDFLIHPMHCLVWSFEQKCLKYFDFDNGVYIQPKLDGVRCLARIKNGKVVFTSRGGKKIMWLDHLRSEVMLFLAGSDSSISDNHIILDCEVYAHVIYGVASYDENKKKYSYKYCDPTDYNDGSIPELDSEQRFDVISGAVRPKRNEPHPLENQLCLYVFDIVDSTGAMDQDERFKILKRLFETKTTSHIKLVETKVIYYPEEIEEFHDEVSEKDYEGVVIRARELTYESHKKSLRMRKHKHFIDEEYPIVDVVCDDGVDKEYFRWVCEKITQEGEHLTTFTVKPMGTTEQRRNWYDHYDEYLGKMLTVRYQTLTYDGIPRFPRGFAIRDYE